MNPGSIPGSWPTKGAVGMALTNKLRSEVFARDKAICAFSGLSLWHLDYGASTHNESDWADHIRPASRGGRDSVDNLVCASSFYNSKKRNNGADNAYLFHNGRPTSHFYWSHGSLTARQVEDMRSHAAIAATDWYINRAWRNLLTGLEAEYLGIARQRTPAYWRKAALGRLLEWKACGGISDFDKRGLIRYPDAPDVQIMLALADASSTRGLLAIYRAAQPYFFTNSDAFQGFIEAEGPAARKRVLERAEKSKWVTEPTLAILRTNTALLAECRWATAENPV